MCERCGDDGWDCQEEERLRNLPYTEDGYVPCDGPCPECGGLLLCKETRDDRGIATHLVCPRCRYNDTDWYDTLDLPDEG